MIKDAAKIMEPANLDTQTKAIVVFALRNGHQIIANKVPHNPTFFLQLLLLLLHCQCLSYHCDQPITKLLQYTYFFQILL